MNQDILNVCISFYVLYCEFWPDDDLKVEAYRYIKHLES